MNVTVSVSVLPRAGEKFSVEASSTAEALRAVLARGEVRAAMERGPRSGLVVSAFARRQEAIGSREEAEGGEA